MTKPGEQLSPIDFAQYIVNLDPRFKTAFGIAHTFIPDTEEGRERFKSLNAAEVAAVANDLQWQVHAALEPGTTAVPRNFDFFCNPQNKDTS